MQACTSTSPAVATTDATLEVAEPDLRSMFLLAMRRVPGAVAIIATAGGGTRKGLAATAWTSLTADPPTLLACVNQSASAHDLVLEAGAFSINLLDGAHTETVAIFSAQRGLNGDERFLCGAWTTGAAGQPLLEQAVVSFECRMTGAHEQGTHSLLIGEVIGVRVRPGADALLYLDGGFAQAVRHQGLSS